MRADDIEKNFCFCKLGHSKEIVSKGPLVRRVYGPRISIDLFLVHN